MMRMLIGFILGIVVSTVGFTTVAQFADQGVQKIQQITKEVTQ